MTCTVGFRNSFTRSLPCGLVGRRRYAKLGPFSARRASLSWVVNVGKSIGIVADLFVTFDNKDKRRRLEIFVQDQLVREPRWLEDTAEPHKRKHEHAQIT